MKFENKEQALEKVLHSFERYYSINKENVTQPFAAEAEFISHNEQYFLVKSAKIANIDSNEYVYFALTETLSKDKFLEFDEKAWNTGISRVHPYSGHRNSDVTLVIIADKIEDEVKSLIKKTKHSKSYKLTFWGWSNYKLVSLELSTDQLFSNRLGKDLKKLFSK